MISISPQLFQSLIAVLLENDYCDDLQKLKDLFSDNRIQAWRHSLPGLEFRSTQERVILVINYLHKKRNIQGVNGLSLFLQVLIDRTPPGDYHYLKLKELLAKLDSGNTSKNSFTGSADSVRESPHRLRLPNKPIVVEIYPLSVKLRYESESWFVELQNKGQQPLRKVTLVFRLQPTMFIRPQTLSFKTIEAFSVSPKSKVQIDMNLAKMRESSVCSLAFEVVYLESGMSIRREGIFNIEMTSE